MYQGLRGYLLTCTDIWGCIRSGGEGFGNPNPGDWDLLHGSGAPKAVFYPLNPKVGKDS